MAIRALTRSFFALLVGGGTALAATATGVLNVRMNITATCAIGTTGDLDHGSLNVLSALVDTQASMQVLCSSGAPFNVSLNGGLNGTGASDRKMKSTSGVNTISYQLYRDAARSQVWGETIGVDTATSTGTGATQSFTIYSRVPAQTLQPVGTYTDTVTVTLTY